MNEKDVEELNLRAKQIENGGEAPIQLPTQVVNEEAPRGLTEREQKIWEVYLTLLSREPQRNNIEGVQWAADSVTAFEKWVAQKRTTQQNG